MRIFRRVPLSPESRRLRLRFTPHTSELFPHVLGWEKTFASFHDNHDSDVGTAIWCNATFDSQSDLVALDSDVFFVPPFVGPSG